MSEQPEHSDRPRSRAQMSMHSIASSAHRSLQIDNGAWDRDSALGGMTFPDSTMSVSSSIYDHVEENGRTYHRYREGKYMLPNDKVEQERLDYQHRVLTFSSEGRLYLAPLDENVRNVLDVATGTGIWAIEFGRDHPGTTVLGTDLSPIQPPYAPPNVSFEISDAEDEWSFSQKFDFIHMRAILTCFADPKAVFQQAFDALEPGGFIELRDPIMPFQFLTPPPEDSALRAWCGHIETASSRIGRTWNNAQHYAEWLEDLGYVNIFEKREYAALSPWPKGQRNKQLSMLVQHDILNGLESMSMALFTRVLGWEPVQVREFLERVKEDIVNTKIHAYTEGVQVYAQKPYS